MCSGSTRPGNSTVPSGNSGQPLGHPATAVARRAPAARRSATARRVPSRWSRNASDRCGASLDLAACSNRIDLRGARRRGRGATCCRAPGSTSTPPSTRSRPIVEEVRERGVERGPGGDRALRRRRPGGACGCRPTAIAAAAAALDPDVARGAARRDRARPRGARRPAAAPTSTAGGAGRHGHRALAAGPPGRPLRAGRPGGLPVQRRDERGAGPGRRRRRASRWPARRRRTPACRDPRVLAACALLGVDEVYAVGGAQAIAMFAYGAAPDGRASRSTWSPGPATSTSPRPSGWCAALVGIDAEAGPTEIAILADDTADPVHVAADLISQAEHDPLAASVLVTTSADAGRRGRRRAGPAGRRDQARRAGHARRWPARSPAIVLVDDLDAGLRGRRRVRGRAPGDPDRGTRARWPTRVRNAGAIFVGAVLAGLARRLLRRLQPRAADRRLRPAHRRAVGADVPARHRTSSSTTRRRCATSPRTWSRWPRPRTCRRTAQAVTAPGSAP